jgi:hypothetical protein
MSPRPSDAAEGGVSAPSRDLEAVRLRSTLVRISEILEDEGRTDSEAYLFALAALHRPGPRSCSCRLCGNRFAFPGQLAEHLDRVHGDCTFTGSMGSRPHEAAAVDW